MLSVVNYTTKYKTRILQKIIAYIRLYVNYKIKFNLWHTPIAQRYVHKIKVIDGSNIFLITWMHMLDVSHEILVKPDTNNNTTTIIIKFYILFCPVDAWLPCFRRIRSLVSLLRDLGSISHEYNFLYSLHEHIQSINNQQKI